MAKSTDKPKAHRLKSTTDKHTFESATVKLSDLRQDLDLWYRIHVLLYDLANVKDPPSENRLSSTMNELYISEPYFRDHEATSILSALTDDFNKPGPPPGSPPGSPNGTSTGIQHLSVEQALHSKLENFLEKRKASGDARPCGPHDMIPIYSDVFGITKEELGDERFLGRLRRSGLGDSSARTGIEAPAKETGKEPSRKLGRKGKK